MHCRPSLLYHMYRRGSNTPPRSKSGAPEPSVFLTSRFHAPADSSNYLKLDNVKANFRGRPYHPSPISAGLRVSRRGYTLRYATLLPICAVSCDKRLSCVLPVCLRAVCALSLSYSVARYKTAVATAAASRRRARNIKQSFVVKPQSFTSRMYNCEYVGLVYCSLYVIFTRPPYDVSTFQASDKNYTRQEGLQTNCHRHKWCTSHETLLL